MKRLSRHKAGRIPAMTPLSVHEYLTDIGRSWTGQGCAVELGSWLGASIVPLINGLREAGYDQPVFCYDRWFSNMEQVGIAAEFGVKLSNRQDLLPLFRNNVDKVYDNVVAIRGRMPGTVSWDDRPIEICLFDAPKRPEVFVPCIEKLAPYFIEGITIFGLLDFYFYESKQDDPELCHLLKVPVRYIDFFSSNYTKLKDFHGHASCVFFRYEGGDVWSNSEKWAE